MVKRKKKKNIILSRRGDKVKFTDVYIYDYLDKKRDDVSDVRLNVLEVSLRKAIGVVTVTGNRVNNEPMAVKWGPGPAQWFEVEIAMEQLEVIK